jgi:beta-hydroxylase
MVATSTDNPQKPAKPLRKRRYKIVKRFGKKMIYALASIQSRQSLVGDTPVLENKHFPYLQPFADNWRQIRTEVEEILKYREIIPAFQEVSPDQWRISKEKNWRTFILYGFRKRMNKNCTMAPVTTRLLEQVPNLQTAWFSILAPGYHIPPHTGVTKGIVRAHLGLIVPKDNEHCRLRVADVIKVWKEGELFVFDDTFEHEVWNDTEEERVILLFDFDRPMRLVGRALNATILGLIKLTAFYQEPRRNMIGYENRFEAAVRRADANLEKLSDI